MYLNNRGMTRYEYFITFFIVFVALCFRIDIINKRIACIVGFGLLALDIMVKLSNRNVSIQFYSTDLFWLIHFLLFVFHRDPNYPLQYSMFFLLGWFSMFLLRNDIRNIKAVMDALLVFSFLNLLVNLVTITAPNFYRNLTQLLFSNYSWNGNLAGLGGDAGRNAYYCIAGVAVIYSSLLARTNKHRWFSWIEIIILVAIVFATGKLGHSLFVVATMLFVLLLTENSLTKRMRRLFVFMIVGAIIFAIIYEVFPEVQYLFTRALGKADISSGRFMLWDYAIRLFKDHPIFGIGYGSFSVNSLSITNYAVYVGIHNDYLQWLCEGGIVGLGVNLIISLGTFALTVKEVKKLSSSQDESTGFHRMALIWSLFIQTFILLYSLTGIPHFSYEINTVFYFACSVPFCLCNTGIFDKDVYRRYKGISVRI